MPDDFLGEKPKEQKLSLGQKRALSILGMVGSVVFVLVYLWSAHNQTTWTETDATVKTRVHLKKSFELTVEFRLPDNRTTTNIIREWKTPRGVGEIVRIRYDLLSSGVVDDARLVEEPILRQEFLIGPGVLFLIALGVGYVAWFRQPAKKRRRR